MKVIPSGARWVRASGTRSVQKTRVPNKAADTLNGVVAARRSPFQLAVVWMAVLGCQEINGEPTRARGALADAPSPEPRAVAALGPERPAVPAPEPPAVAAPPEVPAPDPAAARRARFPNEFQLASMRGTSHAPYLEGNTREAIQAAVREGIRYLEVDFVLTRDGSLITAHQSYVKGCGTLGSMLESQVLGCRLHGGLRLATLETILKLPFKGLFLDLKDTRQPDPVRAQQAVERAARAVVASQRTGDVVLMLYDTPPSSVRPVVEHGLRGGIKGYPKSVEESARMVARAAELGFETVSVNTDYVTPELLSTSTRLGVWHLPWSTKPASADHWRALAASGAGGLIALHYELAREHVAPHWVDARSLDSAGSR